MTIAHRSPRIGNEERHKEIDLGLALPGGLVRAQQRGWADCIGFVRRWGSMLGSQGWAVGHLDMSLRLS